MNNITDKVKPKKVNTNAYYMTLVQVKTGQIIVLLEH